MDIKNRPLHEKQNKNKRKQNELFWLIIPQCDLLVLSNICRTTRATKLMTRTLTWMERTAKKEIVAIFPCLPIAGMFSQISGLDRRVGWLPSRKSKRPGLT
ncbi:hypothetical protein KP509_17G046500 [Ceratopteris richardii]|uniref:Uncharacterized protein n=1 Tax=Ceratopteris richardii TaxID=49495 RepID=A0A8T2SVH3_CERRI|nr:hypothetical protein KP509_17G046500 [Ceratopteris richardii]